MFVKYKFEDWEKIVKGLGYKFRFLNIVKLELLMVEKD